MGYYRNFNLEYSGVTDASGNHACAFAYIPVHQQTKDSKAHKIPSNILGPDTFSMNEPFMIAINNAGKSAKSVFGADEIAGVHGYRQKYWVPTSK